MSAIALGMMRWGPRAGLALSFAMALGCGRRAEMRRPSPTIALPPVTAFVEYAKEPLEVPVAPACVAKLGGGVHVVEHDGLPRRFVLDLPGNAPASAVPLIVAYHGWGGDPEQLDRSSRIVDAATSRGFAVARPFGIGKTFAAGACCGEATGRGVDDVGTARAIVARLVDEACVDPQRVYATGFSNGGFLAHRLGCEASDVFAAIASVAGPLGVSRCAPTNAVSVLQIHGRLDGVVPFAGDSSKRWSSVAATIRTWTDLDGCAAGASTESYARGAARCVTNAVCRGGTEVMLCRDDRAAHTWPGGPSSVGWGGSQDLDATSTILDFFVRHRR